MKKTAQSTWHHGIGIALALLVLVSPWIFWLFVPMVLNVILLPFIGFDFTSVMDFVPVGIIAVSFIGLALRHAKRPYPGAWLRFARWSAYTLTVLPPLLLLAALYLLSWYGFRATHHWPQPMINDPKLLARNDAAYQTMFAVTDYVEAISVALIWIWVALLLHLRRYLTRKTGVVLFCVFLAAWLLFAIEPGLRFAWWLD